VKANRKVVDCLREFGEIRAWPLFLLFLHLHWQLQNVGNRNLAYGTLITTDEADVYLMNQLHEEYFRAHF